MAVTPSYVEGSTVNITVNIPTVSGAVVVPTSISYQVTDETGTVLDGPNNVSIPAPGVTTLALVIDSTDNMLGTEPAPNLDNGTIISKPRALRQITTTFETLQGQFIDNQYYILNSATPLVRMVNSFITLPETYLTRYEMNNMSGWDNASFDDQMAALATAYENMLQLRYRFPIGENFQSRIVDFYGMSVDNVFGRIFMVLADIAYYGESDYEGWPTQFQNALKRGQMAEANYLLSGDPIIDKRNQGVLSEKVGEASMSFRRVPDIVMPVSKDALQHLRGYLNNAIIIGRA